jgi:hypothetical protein
MQMAAIDFTLHHPAIKALIIPNRLTCDSWNDLIVQGVNRLAPGYDRLRLGFGYAAPCASRNDYAPG